MEHFAAISHAVLSPRSASSATVALNLSEKQRLFVICVSRRDRLIHLSSLSSFAELLLGPSTGTPPSAWRSIPRMLETAKFSQLDQIPLRYRAEKTPPRHPPSFREDYRWT
jgi:hypothetical protein